MRLRTRVSITAGAGLAALALLFAGAGGLRESLASQRLAETAIAGQIALWEEAIAVETGELHRQLDVLATDATLVAAVRSGDHERIAREVGALVGTPAPGMTMMLAVMSSQREVLHATHPELATALLDASTFDRVMGGARAQGLRHASIDSPWLLAATRIQGTDSAVLVIGRSVMPVLRRMATRLEGSATLLTSRGHVAAGSDPAQWSRLHAWVAPNEAAHESIEFGDSMFTLTAVPVRDIAGDAAGSLVVLSDRTASLASARSAGLVTLLGALALAVGVIALLDTMLRRSFQPLESAISTLSGMSGEASQTRLGSARADEISSLAHAVAAFRRNAHALSGSRALRERVRRRQESMIRKQLDALAGSIDVDHDDRIVGLLSPVHTGAGEDEPLRRLAAVMGELTGRIVDQHRSLRSMIEELREALVTRTRLAAIEKDLQIAAQVQRSILPRELPSDTRIDLGHCLAPARDIGGDFYDYFMLDDERLAFVIADVSGKGVPAALFMAVARTLLKSAASFLTEPSQCMRVFNDRISAENEQMLFVTVFYGVLHLPTGRVDYVNAGHNPPYLLTGDGVLSPVDVLASIPVGVLEGFDYETQTLQLSPGDRLFLYTDGVTEAFDPGQVAFGEEGLERQLTLLGTQALPQQTCDTVLEEVRRFEAGEPASDDVTCVCLRFLGAATG